MKNREMKYTKRLALGVLTFTVLGAGAIATKVSAQNVGVFEIQVPFDFVLKGRAYPAARYQIGRLNQSNPDTLVLNSSTGKTLAMFQTQRFNSSSRAEFSILTFKLSGVAHILDSVRASGSSYESRVPPNKLDRRRGEIAQSSLVSISTK